MLKILESLRLPLIATNIVVAVLLIVIATDLYSYVGVKLGLFDVLVTRSDAWLLALRLPLWLYVAAIMFARAAMKQISKGETLNQVLPSKMLGIGVMLILGSVVSVFNPLILKMVDEGETVGNLDPAGIATGIIGLLILMVRNVVVDMQVAVREVAEFI